MPEALELARRRWPKRLLIGAALLAVLVAGGYVALLRSFPPERIAVFAAEQVRARTGRDFAIEGGLRYRIFPRLAVVARGLVLGNAPWGTRKDMLRVERAALDLELWPFLQGRFQVRSVEFDGVDLWFETDRKGAGNWVFTAPSADRVAAPVGSNASRPSIELDALRLRTVTVTYRGGGGKAREFTLERLDLDRNDDGNRVDAEWVIERQRWHASGQLGRLDVVFANVAQWPFDLTLSSEGARIDAKGRVVPGTAFRSTRLELEAKIDKAAALAPWMADPSRVPLPIEAKSTLVMTPSSVRADLLRVSIAGQTLAGHATLSEGEPWRVDAELRAGSFDLTQAWPKRQAGSVETTTAGGPRLLFGDDRLPIEVLPDARARIALRIEQLLLPATPPLSGVTAHVDLAAATLKVEPFSFDLAGGQVHGGFGLETRTKASPRVSLRIDASGLSAETLARAAGAGGKIGGGRLELKTDLAMTGNTPRALAAGASGNMLLSVTDATLADGMVPIGPSLLPRILQAVNPRRGAAGPTHVDCAVLRLALHDGLAVLDRSIAVETSELVLSASGRIDLRDQTLELAMRPTSRGAPGFNPAQLASLVVAKGPLLDPRLTLDAKAAANAALSIGAAAASGGWSLLGKSLLQQSSDPHPCVHAATGVASSAPSAPTAPAARAETTPGPAGKPAPRPEEEVRKLLRNIFK